MTRLALLLALLAPGVAWGVPPDPGSPTDLELKRDFTPSEQQWIAQQHDMTGRWFCSLGDFDFVELDTNGDTVKARAKHPNAAKGIPSGWLDVPVDKQVDLRGQTEIPNVIAAWFYQGHIQCILMGSGY